MDKIAQGTNTHRLKRVKPHPPGMGIDNHHSQTDDQHQQQILEPGPADRPVTLIIADIIDRFPYNIRDH